MKAIYINIYIYVRILGQVEYIGPEAQSEDMK